METLSAPRCGLNLIWSKLVKRLFFFGYNQISYFRGNHWDTFYNYPKLGGHAQELKDMWEGMKQDSAYKSVGRLDVLLGGLQNSVPWSHSDPGSCRAPRRPADRVLQHTSLRPSRPDFGACWLVTWPVKCLGSEQGPQPD